MCSIFEKIKKYEPENYAKFRRLENLSQEIERLECGLTKGMISSQIFNQLVLKLKNLEEEFFSLIYILLVKQDYKCLNYHREYMEYSEKERKKIREKFKFTKCGWCDSLIREENGRYCPNYDCESHEFLSSDDE